MKYKQLLLALLLIGTVIGCKHNENTESTSAVTATNGVYFVNLKDGDKVKSPVIIQMGVKGMNVEPAGAMHDSMGHHHLIIDGTWIEKGTMVPKDSTHLHFGKGQTVDTLSLSPGEHTLTLQFADGMHRSYGKEWSSTIKITVVQ
jgi:hypothetical protein